MATLRDQWQAAFGPSSVSGAPPPSSSDAEPATQFRQRCIMAAVGAAIAIGSEATTVPDHANRVGLAKAVTDHPVDWMDAFAAACASQSLDNTSVDSAISNAVAAVWNTLAGAL